MFGPIVVDLLHRLKLKPAPLVLLAGIFAALLSELAGAVREPEHVVLQLPFTHQFQFAGYYAAQFKGYYAAEHLDVELRPNQKNAPSISEVVEGRAEYGIFQGAGLLIQWMRSGDVQVLAAIMQHSPFAVAVREDSDIHGPRDLLRARFAVEPIRLAIEVKLMLEKEGLDFTKLHVVPNRWGYDELGAGTADAMDFFVTNLPSDLRLYRGERWRVIYPRDYGVDFYGDCLYGRRDYIDAHPAQAEAMRRATLKGWEYALSHPEEVQDWILHQLPGRPGNLSAEMLQYESKGLDTLVDASFVEIGHMNPGRWQAMHDGIVRCDKAIPTRRLAGFLFVPPENRPLQLWVQVLLVVSGVGLFLTALAVYTNRRLRKLVEIRAQELRASEVRMRNFVENASIGIYRSTPAGRIVFANDALVRMMGYGSLAELTARDLEQDGYEPSYSRSEFKARIEQNGMVQGLEAAWKRKDGTTIYVRESASVIRDEQGQAQYYDGIIEDVTSRKQAELALRESEERFRNLTAAAFEGIVIMEQGCIIDINDQALRLIGYTREELLGRNVLAFIGQESRAEAESNIRKNIETGYELVLVRKDGSRFHAECQVKMMRQGDRALRMTAFRDITERLEAEQRQRLMEEQLRQKQKMEAVGTLAGGIAHDFNNILTGILGNLQIAELDLDPMHPAYNGLVAARKASVRARDLVARILAFSRQENEKRAPAPLGPIIQEALQLLRVGLPSNVELRVALDEKCPPVSFDPSQIHQIVMNLGTNSLQAMQEHGGLIAVELGVVKPSPALREHYPQVSENHTVRLTVSDDGCGMPPEVLHRIFEPFYTTKAFGRGTGLGLSTVHAIMKNHQGAVVVESAAGSGTTFSLYFPAAEVPKQEHAPAAIAIPPPAGTRSPFGQGRVIMLVDDEDFVREVSASVLRRLGFTPAAFANPVDALSAFRAAPDEVAAVITDMAMPEMTGLELSRKLLDIRPGVPILLASGFFRADVTATARSWGINGFINKPFEVQELIKQIRSILQETGSSVS